MTIAEAEIKNLESAIRDNEREFKKLHEDIQNKKFYFGWCMFAAVMFLGTTFWAISQRDGWQDNYNKIRRQAIELGHAQYNPTNGVWEWKR